MVEVCCFAQPPNASESALRSSRKFLANCSIAAAQCLTGASSIHVTTRLISSFGAASASWTREHAGVPNHVSDPRGATRNFLCGCYRGDRRTAFQRKTDSPSTSLLCAAKHGVDAETRRFIMNYAILHTNATRLLDASADTHSSEYASTVRSKGCG